MAPAAQSASLNATTIFAGVAFAGLAATSLNTVQCEALPVYGKPGTNQERTFLAVKPDGVQRGIVGDIIARFEKRGYKLVGLKMVWPSKEMAEAHYADLKGKPFFAGLTTFFSSGPIVCMCWEGKDIIKQGRQMLGETQPLASKPGSIRGDFSIE
jgi:nucleoside-diphosphate kinase